MNSTFKVVFNKARGALMVVNEATHSIQSKGTKTVVATAVASLLSMGGAAVAAQADMLTITNDQLPTLSYQKDNQTITSPTQKLVSGQGQTINIQTVGNTGGLVKGVMGALGQSGMTNKVGGILSALSPTDGSVTLTGVTGGNNLMNQATKEKLAFPLLGLQLKLKNQVGDDFTDRFYAQFQDPQDEKTLTDTHIIIGGEQGASPLVLGAVGGDLALNLQQDLTTKSQMNSLIEAKSGNTLGIIGGSVIVADTYGLESEKPVAVNATAQGGQTDIQISGTANAALVLGGGLAAGVKDANAISNVAASKITVNTAPAFNATTVDGLVAGVLGGGTAVSMAKGSATADVTGATQIDLQSGMVLGTIGGGLAMGFDMAVPADRATDIKKPDGKSDFATNLQNSMINQIKNSLLQEGSGTSSVTSGDVSINVGEKAKTAALMGGAVAIADAYGNNVGTSTADVKSVTMVLNGLQSQDLTGADREAFQKSKPTMADAKAVKNAIATKNFAQLGTALDKLNVDGVHVATMGGGLAMSRGYFNEVKSNTGSATATSHVGTVDLTLNGGYNVATALGGLAISLDKNGQSTANQMSAKSVVDEAHLTITGGENVMVSAGGLAYATAKNGKTDKPVSDSLGLAHSQITNATVNMTGGWVDGLFGGGIAVDATNSQATNASTHTQNVAINVTGGKLFGMTIDPLINIGKTGNTSGVPSDRTFVGETAKLIGGQTALVGGAIASGAGAQATVDNVSIALGNSIVDGNIVMGGVASLGGTSTVGTSSLTVNGAQIDGAIIAGGLSGTHSAFDAPYQSGTATLGTANIDLVAGSMTHGISAKGVDTLNVTLHEAFDLQAHLDAHEAKMATLNLLGSHDFKSAKGNRAGINVDGFNALDVKDNSHVVMGDLVLDTSLTLGVGSSLRLDSLATQGAQTVAVLAAPVEPAPAFKFDLKSADILIGTNTVETFAVQATGTVNDAVAGDVNELMRRLGKSANEQGQFEGLVTDGKTPIMAEGEAFGAVTVAPDGTVHTAKNTKNEAKAQMLNNAPRMMARVQMNELRKRMGDVRAGEGDSGVWARYNGGKFSGDYGLDTDFHMIQAGVDTVPAADTARFGVALSFAKADAEDNFSSADMDSVSLAGYGVWAADNGLFADVIARMAKVNTDFTYGGNSAKLDNMMLSASGELGWRFDLTEQVYVEPSAELTYTYMDGENFTLGNVSHAIGSMDSLIARAGITAGMKCPGGFGDAYVRVAGVHEFLGDTSMTSTVAGNVASLPSDGKDSWLEYAVGANINFNKSTYMYVDIERTAGADIEEDWRANVGVRYSF